MSNTSLWHQRFAQDHVSRQNTEIITEHTNVSLCQRQISQQVLTEVPVYWCYFLKNTSRALVHYPIRRLIARSCEVSKPRYLCLELSDRSEIWQVPRQQCCRGACQISKRYDDSNYQLRGFETSQDLRIRRLIVYWNRTFTNIEELRWTSDSIQGLLWGVITHSCLNHNDCLTKLPSDLGHTLPWHQHGHEGVSNHQPHCCLLNRSFWRRSKKTSKLRVTGFCAGNSSATGEFPAQMASNAESVSIWWRHHDMISCYRSPFDSHCNSMVLFLFCNTTLWSSLVVFYNVMDMFLFWHDRCHLQEFSGQYT